MEMGKFTDKKSFQRYIYDLHIIYSTDIYCNVSSSTAGCVYEPLIPPVLIIPQSFLSLHSGLILKV